jgi:hypothetical protein
VNSWKVVRLTQIPIGIAALGVGIYDITRGAMDNVAVGLLLLLLGIAAGVLAISSSGSHRRGPRRARVCGNVS